MSLHLPMFRERNIERSNQRQKGRCRSRGLAWRWKGASAVGAADAAVVDVACCWRCPAMSRIRLGLGRRSTSWCLPTSPSAGLRWVSGSLTAAAINGVLAIDHVVAMSPALDRTVRALRAAGLELRRMREQPTPAGAPRQAFFRLGGEILEVVQEPDDVVERGGGRARPACLWGLALIVEDLDRTVEVLGEHAGPIRPAVQPGRRIAPLRRGADLAVPVALMTARPDR
jgi:hypothetical protein